MPVRKMTAAELLGGRAQVVFPGSPLFARLKKFREEKAAKPGPDDDADPPAK